MEYLRWLLTLALVTILLEVIYRILDEKTFYNWLDDISWIVGIIGVASLVATVTLGFLTIWNL